MIRNCNFCATAYHAEARYVNRGQGLYCTQSCASKAQHANRPKPTPNVVCSFCSNSFYKSNSKLKVKSGFHFCTRKCKDSAQRLGGIKEIMPSHYGTAKTEDYRLKAFSFYDPKCRKCGWNQYPQVLEVNHINCDRSNNSIENLEILCPTCHRVYHFTTKTGPWGPKS